MTMASHPHARGGFLDALRIIYDLIEFPGFGRFRCSFAFLDDRIIGAIAVLLLNIGFIRNPQKFLIILVVLNFGVTVITSVARFQLGTS